MFCQLFIKRILDWIGLESILCLEKNVTVFIFVKFLSLFYLFLWFLLLCYWINWLIDWLMSSDFLILFAETYPKVGKVLDICCIPAITYICQKTGSFCQSRTAENWWATLRTFALIKWTVFLYITVNVTWQLSNVTTGLSHGYFMYDAVLYAIKNSS